MGNYDRLTRAQLIERLEKVEQKTADNLQNAIEGEKRIAKVLMLILQDHGNYEEDIMRIVLEHYQANRAFLFKFDWENGTNSNIFEVNSPGTTTEIQNLQNLPNEALGKNIERFRKGAPLVISDIEQMPEDEYEGRDQMKEVFRNLGLKSAILFPLKIFGELWGYVGMETVEYYKNWDKNDIKWLQAFTDVLCIGIGQKLIQARANQNAQRFEKLFDNMPIAFVRHRIICDKHNQPVDYEFLEVNPAFEKLTGISKEECIGKTASQISRKPNDAQFNIYADIAFNGKQAQLDYYSHTLKGWYSSVLYSPQYGEFISLFYDITERYNTNEKIRQNEKKLRSIFDNLPVGIISFDKDGNFLDSNAKTIEIFGLKNQDEIQQKKWLTPELEINLQQAKEITFDFIYDPIKKCILQNKDEITEAAKYLLGKLIMYSDDQESRIGYLLITIDNTASYKANQKIRESEQLWSQVADAAKIFNWKYNIRTRRFSVSDEILQYEKTAAEVDKVSLLMKHINRIRKKDLSKLQEKWEESIRNRANVLFEITYTISNDEKNIYCTSRWTKKIVEGDEIIYGITFDISELMLAEQKLKENLVRLSLILETGDIYPWYLDLQNGSLDITEEFYKAFNQEKVEHPQFSIADFISLIHPDDLDLFKKEFSQLQAGITDRMRLELRLNINNVGYQWFELNAAVKARGEYSTITQLLGFLIIIQKRKDNERQLIEAMKKAEESDKLKSAFLANVSHEIRTPLNAIVGFSEIVAHSENLEEKNYFLEIIKTNNNLLLNLINDILDLSKIESGRIDLKNSVVDVNALCQELCTIHQLKASSGIQVIFASMNEPLAMVTDGNRLRQLYSNLIGNALKNTAKGSITVSYRKKGDMVEFAVKDTGKGISQDKQHKIFNRFEKLDSNIQGFGLGLSICKSILEKMGGEISFDSEPGVGSEFRFCLPYHTMKPDIGLPAKPLTVPSRLCKASEITILIAEDIQCNLQLLEAILGKKYKLLNAHNGIEAINIFSEQHPDLILMDMKMPELDGIEATKIIREISPDIPIIALTAFAYDSDKEIAIAAGCNDFITKPVDSTLLKAMIDKYTHHATQEN